jgi:7,8-dihydropterin-6-yl-methyl-4-(beta-D-ribofuranosyl)aminobenzene 5'-phosphate synthase
MLDQIESGKVILKVLTTNEVSITKLTEDKFNGKVIQPGKSVNRAIAEHGFAMSIQIKENEETHLFLLDTGGLTQAITENSKQFNVNLNDVEKLVLSHGHFDHFGGLTSVIPELKEGTKFYLNPDCYQQFFAAVTEIGEELSTEDLLSNVKRLEKEGKLKLSGKMPLLSKNLIQNLAEQHKIELIETKEPIELYKGITTSGEIELFDENELTKGIYVMKSRKDFEKHYFRDETAIYFNIKDKGLVVLTGCGHCGIMNTIKHGQKLTGIDKVYAVIGGFHEEWNPIEKVRDKVKYFEDINPEIICGMHCTGFNFNNLMSQHPAHTLGMVGTEFHL